MHVLKKRILAISLFLMIWCFRTDSPFQKGGIKQTMQITIVFLFLVIAFIYFSAVQSFIMAEKILYSLFLTFLSLVISYLLTAELLETKYGFDYQIFLSNSIANLIFYFLTNGFLILFTLLILKIKSIDLNKNR